MEDIKEQIVNELTKVIKDTGTACPFVTASVISRVFWILNFPNSICQGFMVLENKYALKHFWVVTEDYRLFDPIQTTLKTFVDLNCSLTYNLLHNVELIPALDKDYLQSAWNRDKELYWKIPFVAKQSRFLFKTIIRFFKMYLLLYRAAN